MPTTTNQAPGGVYQPWMRLPNRYETVIIVRAAGLVEGFGVAFGDAVLFDDLEIEEQETTFDVAAALKTVIEASDPDLTVTAVSGRTADAIAEVRIIFTTAEPILDYNPTVVESSGYLDAGNMQVTPARPR